MNGTDSGIDLPPRQAALALVHGDVMVRIPSPRTAPRPMLVPPARTLGDPSPALESLHRPAIVDRWYADARDLLLDPIRVVTAWPGTVVFAGVLRFRFSPDGELGVARHDLGIRTCRRSIALEAIDFAQPLSPEAWLDDLRDDLAARLAGERDPRRVDAHYLDWAIDAMRARFEPLAAWKRFGLDACVRAGLDPEIVGWLAALRIDDRPQELAVHVYNRMLAHRDELRTLARDNAALIPHYIACRDEPFFDRRFPARELPDEPLARLRAYLATRGLGKAAWRRLASPGGPRFLATLLEDPALPASRMTEVLDAANSIGFQHEPPDWLVSAVRRRSIVPPLGPAEHIGLAPTIVGRRVAVLHRLADDATRATMQSMIEPLLDWAWRTEDYKPRDLARLGWTTLERRVREDLERREQNDYRFPAPFDTLLFAGHEVTALRSARALWQEGCDMKHCAASLQLACMVGATIALSARGVDDPRSRWTIAFRRRARGWKLLAVAGSCNRPPTPQATRVVREVAAWLSKHERARDPDGFPYFVVPDKDEPEGEGTPA